MQGRFAAVLAAALSLTAASGCVVVGARDVWFLDGSYFRWYGERWEIGVDLDGPWRVATAGGVPARLRDERHPHGGPPGQLKKRGKP
jgi:hypothetical protein